VDDLTWLAMAARDGNRPALSTLIHRTQGDVWRLCHRLGPAGMADDLTQDVYVRLVRSLDRFRGDSSVRTWILSIARHVAIDAVRARRRRERLDGLFLRAVDDEMPDHSADFDGLIATLDVDQRAAFVLTQLHGLSYSEAADVCGCPIGTIRSRVARAREALVLALQDAPESGMSTEFSSSS
jgi:RNA polymerase sigma-70 factor (ECF subfamily)